MDGEGQVKFGSGLSAEAGTVFPGGNTLLMAELAGEVVAVVEPNPEGDIRDRLGGLSQHVTGMLDSQADEIGYWCCPRRRFEGPEEIAP